MANLLRVLIVEDSEDDAQLILRQLRSGGYELKWERVQTAEAMTSSLDREQWDVILCDYRMPLFSAPAALNLIQDRKIDIPFIVVSGTIGEDAAIAMMKAGAHDYLMKDKLARLVVAIEREIHEAGIRHEKKKTEEELQRSEQSFKSISENAHDGIIVTLRNGAYIYANRRASEITGYAIDEIFKASIEGLAHPDERLKLSERRNKILAGENVPNQYDTVIIHKNGNAVPIEITSARTFWYGQTADILILRDITERKQAEEALNLKNRMLMSINNYIQAIAFVPQDRLFTTIVTKLKEITGAAEIIINIYDEQKSELVCLQSTLSEERNTWIRKTLGGNLVGYRTPVSKESYEEMTSSVIGRVGSIHEVTFGAIPAPVGKLIEKVFGFGWFVGLALKHNERLEGTIMIAGKPETTPPENEELVAYATAIANVMARRKAEEALRESEENYRRSLSDSPLGIRIVSAEGKTLYANQAILDIYGYDSMEELRTTPHKEIYTPQSYAEHLVRKEQRQRDEYVASNYEISIIRKDGEIRHLDVFRKEVLWNGEAQFQVLYNDITERKQAEEALQASEEKYSTLVENATDGVTIIQDKVFKFANTHMAEMSGYTVEELTGMSTFDLVPPDFAPKVNERFALRAQGADVPKIFSTQLLCKDGTLKEMESSAKLIQYEGSPATIAITRDVTERKRMEETLRAGEELLKAQFDNSPDIILIVDHNFKYVKINRILAGPFTTEGLVGQDAIATLPPSTREPVRKKIAACFDTGEVQEIEHEIGEGIWVRARIVPIKSDGIVKYVMALSTDITERKRAQEALRDSEERFRSLIEKSSDVIIVINRDFKISYVSPSFRTVFDRDPSELSGKSALDFANEFVHQDDVKTVMKAFEGCLEMPGAERQAEFRFKLLDGSWLNIEATGKNLLDNPSIQGLVVNIRNVTERKQAEEALRQSEMKFRSIVEYALEGILILDLQGTILLANNAAVRTIEADDCAGLIGRNVMEFIAPESRENVIGDFIQVSQGHDAYLSQYNVISVKGNKFCVESIGKVISYEGKPADLISIRDITERKRAEAALRESEERFKELFKHMTSGVAIYEAVDEGTDFIFRDFNSAAEKIERLKRPEVIGKRVTEIFPGVKESGIFEMFQRVWRTAQPEFFSSLFYKDERNPGSWRDSWVYKLPSGEIVAIYNDITERKQAEEALQREHMMLERTEDIAQIGSWEWDVATDTVTWSDELFRIFQRDPREGAPSFAEHPAFYHPDDMARLQQAVAAAVAEGTPYELELRAIRKDGETRVCVARGVPEMAPGGRAVRLFGSLQDITERKKAEEKLRFFALAVESSSDAIGMSTPNGKHYYQNKAFSDIFGDIGKDPSASLYVDEQVGHEVFRTIMEGNQWTGEVKMRGKAGELVNVFLRAYAIKDETERILGLVGVHTDITERKKAEEALRESEEKIRSLLEASPDIIMNINREGNILFINRTLMRNIEDVTGTSVFDHIPPEHRSLYAKTMENVFRTGQPDKFVTRGTGPGGRTSWYESRFVGAESGAEIHSLMVVATDITERKQAEETLVFNNVILSTQQETSLDGILVVDDNSRIISYNQRFVDMWDIPVDIVESKSDERALRSVTDKLINPEEFIRKVQHLYEKRQETSRDDIALKDGKTFDRYSSPMLGADGKYFGRVWYFRDITERKKAEEALRESEGKYRLLAENLSDVIWIMDTNLRYTYVSPSVTRLRGYSVEEAIAQPLEENMTPASLETAMHILVEEAIYAKGQSDPNRPVTLETELSCKDGSTVWVENTITYLRDSNGRVTGYLGDSRDITKRKKAEAALRETEERYKSLFDHSLEAIYIADMNGNFTDANPYALKLLGYEKEEITSLNFLSLVDKKSTEITAKISEEITKTGSQKEIAEYKVIKKDGTYVWIETHASLLYKDGIPVGLQGIARDVTERKRAEETLRESEERFRLAIHATEEGLWEWDIQTNREFFAPRWCEIIGYSFDDPELPHTFKSWASRIHPDDYDRVTGALNNHLENGAKYDVDYRHRHKSGEYRWQNAKGKAVLDESGKPIKMVGCISDITERKRAEELLKKQAQLLMDTGEMARVGGWELDLSTKEVTLTEEVSRIHGLDPGHKLKLEEALSFYAPESRPDVESTVQKSAETGEPYDLESLFIPKGSKDKIWIRSLGKAVYSDGKIVKLAGTFQNIDKYKKAETLMQESEKKYRLLAENASDVITVMDMNMRPIYMSPSITHLLGYSVEESMARGIESSLTPESIKVATKGLAETMTEVQKEKELEPVTVDLEFIRKDGSTVWVSASVALIRGSDGQLAQILSILHDITERKRAEEDLVKYKDHLEELVKERTVELDKTKIIAEEANKAKSEFLANMSHEIRTPLSSIIGFSELLFDETKGPLNDDQKKYLGYVTSSGQHLLSLINDILDLSKVEAGKMELLPTSFSIRDLLKNSFSFIVEKAMKHNIRLLSEISADVDVIEADERKVKQIIYNLLSNAVKFTPDGETITVGADVVSYNSAVLPAKIRKGLPDTEYVLVSVKDTGIGIAKKDQSKLFTEFQQIEEPYTKKYEGTGLGLALSKKLVTLHGGKIWFESKGKGKGCTFYFILPLRILPNA